MRVGQDKAFQQIRRIWCFLLKMSPHIVANSSFYAYLVKVFFTRYSNIHFYMKNPKYESKHSHFARMPTFSGPSSPLKPYLWLNLLELWLMTSFRCTFQKFTTRFILLDLTYESCEKLLFIVVLDFRSCVKSIAGIQSCDKLLHVWNRTINQ